MSIPPQQYKKMTEEEITLAYQGFIRNKINDANLLLLVLKKYKENSFSEISTEKFDINQITIEEKQEILRELNIE